MFKRFSQEENVSSQGQAKSSVQRAIKARIVEQYPLLEGVIDDILPKKSVIVVAKCQNHVQLVCHNKEPLFFNIRDGPYFPTLRLLHKYPGFMPELKVDRGAIPFVLGGANIMCPGLTSPGARCDIDVDADTPVVIRAEGKETELAVGLTKMSTKDIREKNKGIGVDNIHYLNDGLWRTTELN